MEIRGGGRVGLSGLLAKTRLGRACKYGGRVYRAGKVKNRNGWVTLAT